VERDLLFRYRGSEVGGDERRRVETREDADEDVLGDFLLRLEVLTTSETDGTTASPCSCSRKALFASGKARRVFV